MLHFLQCKNLEHAEDVLLRIVKEPKTTMNTVNRRYYVTETHLINTNCSHPAILIIKKPIRIVIIIQEYIYNIYVIIADFHIG